MAKKLKACSWPSKEEKKENHNNEYSNDFSTPQYPEAELPLPIPRRCNAKKEDKDPEFGKWEEHTRKVGSSILKKHGFQFGRGLGKNLQGRMDIIIPYSKPKFSGLGYILESKEEKNEVQKIEDDIQILEEFDYITKKPI